MQKCKKNPLDSAFEVSNIIHQCTDPLIYFKNKGFTPDSHLYVRNSVDPGRSMPKILSTPVNIAANSVLSGG
jgi:hypothetical protein